MIWLCEGAVTEARGSKFFGFLLNGKQSLCLFLVSLKKRKKVIMNNLSHTYLAFSIYRNERPIELFIDPSKVNPLGAEQLLATCSYIFC